MEKKETPKKPESNKTENETKEELTINLNKRNKLRKLKKEIGESKIIENLFTAGQMNGTSGYEEAAGQGIIAGINASSKLEGKDPLILKRNQE